MYMYYIVHFRKKKQSSNALLEDGFEFILCIGEPSEASIDRDAKTHIERAHKTSRHY